MKLKTGIAAILLLILSSPAKAQGGQKYVPVSVGQECPNVRIENITRFNASSAALSAFKGRLLIIDFWATTCRSCIKTLTELDTLQRQFGDQVQVLPVTEEPAVIASRFLQTNARLKGLQLPVVTGDTVLSRLFPHVLLPHEVWIDATGIVRYITSAEAVTADNIQAVLNGKQPVLAVKNDVLHFDAGIPLLAYQNGAPDTAFRFRSLFTNYIEGLPEDVGVIVKDTTTARVFCINYPLLSLYHMAVPALNMLPLNRVLINLKDSASYFFNAAISTWDEWKLKGLFCYDLSVPYADSASMYEWMRQDLNRVFHLDGRMEKRKAACLVLIRTHDTGNLLTKGGVPKHELYAPGKKYIQNMPLSALVHRMNAEPQMPVVLDETNYNNNVDLSFTAGVTDIPALRKELNPYGLDLITAEREVYFFVLTDY